MLQQGLVVFAKNKKRVSAFYKESLGLEVQESESSHDLLRGNGYEVVIHTIPRKYAASITITKPPAPETKHRSSPLLSSQTYRTFGVRLRLLAAI